MELTLVYQTNLEFIICMKLFFSITAPKLKGRPRKRKKIKRPGSPESESASSESSASTTGAVSVASTKVKLASKMP